MKVLHIISDLRRGGRERQLSVLCHYSADQIENHIIAFHNVERNYFNEYNIKNVKFITRNKFKRLSEILKYIKTNNIDLIHTWGNSETLYAAPSAFILRKKILNGSIRHGIRSESFSQIFRSFVLRKSKYVMANSYSGFEANKIKVDSSRHFVLYNGIENKFIHELVPVLKNEKQKELLKTYNNIPVLISVANLIPYKDYFSVLEALKYIKEKGYQFQYLIIGSGPLKEEIIKRIDELNLSNDVILLGSIDNVYDYLKIADIFIHSSRGEGCSNAILEAMAAGLPVIASDTGGTREIVNSNFGFLFEYKNVNQIYNHILSALENLVRIKEMGKAARDEVIKKYSVDAMVKNYLKIIKKITGKDNSN